jgi:hypothetical protein
VGSAALCRVESSAGRHGGDSRTVEMVERRDALRPDGPRPAARNGTLAEAMDGCGVAGVHRRRGIGSRRGSVAALHAHRTTAGESGFRGSSRAINFATARSAKRRASQETLSRLQTSQPVLRRLALENWGTSRLSPHFPARQPAPAGSRSPRYRICRRDRRGYCRLRRSNCERKRHSRIQARRSDKIRAPRASSLLGNVDLEDLDRSRWRLRNRKH